MPFFVDCLTLALSKTHRSEPRIQKGTVEEEPGGGGGVGRGEERPEESTSLGGFCTGGRVWGTVLVGVG